LGGFGTTKKIMKILPNKKTPLFGGGVGKLSKVSK
jgi:hypothetical protein